MPLDPIYLSNVAAGTGGFVIYGRNQADRAGASVASAGDFNGDGFDDLIIGAPYAGQVSNATPLGGEVYVLFGQSGGFSPSILLSAIAAGTGGFVMFGEDAQDQAGRSVASAGDINGDGFDDLIIGASSADSTGNAAADAGDIYVVFGSASGFTTGIDLSSIAAGSGGFVLHGQDVNDHAGFSVASAGDINGDGLGDLLIGAYGGDTVGFSRPTAGDTYVVFGKTTGFGASIDLSTIAAGTGGFVVYGQDSGDRSGTSVASAGDVNGDGFDDLLIGAFYGDGPGNSRSATGDSYVVFGKASGFDAVLELSTIAAGTGGFVIYGVDAGDASGFSVASAGDVNGDGVADLLIGARRAYGAGNAEFFAGEAYVVFGKTTGFDPSINLSAVATGTGGFVIHGQDADDQAGFSVASAGDINGDGFDDLLIGAPYSDAPPVLNSGDSFVVFGKSSGFGAAIDLGTIAAGTGGFIIRGQDDDDQSGRAVAAAGDVDGDGFDDIIIGAPTADGVTNTLNGTGESYVIFGRDFTGTVTKAGTTASETLTGSAGVDDIVAGVGDDILDGLGGVDVLLGGAGDDTIKVADLTFQRVDGGTGTDTLALSGAGTSLDLSTIATTRLRNIEVIDLTGAGDNTLILSARAVLALSGSTNTLKVSGNAGDVLSFGAETWIHTGTAGGYATFTSGQAVVTFSTDLTVARNPVDLVTIAAGTGGFVIYGLDGGDLSGRSVASAGDVNGDGHDDLIIGAYGAAATGNARPGAGESYVVFGKSGGFGAGIELSAIAAGIGGFVIFGQDDADASGSAVALAGDINGDGFDDLIIGSRDADGAGNAKDYAGGAYVVFGKASAFGASIELSDIAAGTGGFVIFGQDDLDFAGAAVASAGDINGDGLDDLIIGAAGGDGAGNTTSGAGDTYVVFGTTGGIGIGIDLGTIAAGTGGFVMHGQDVYDGSGRSVASAGDINGDGLADLIIGAANAESVGNARGTAGEAYVVFGKSDGFDPSTELSTIAAGTGGFIISGQWPYSYTGYSVSSAGDFNGDGFADVIVSALGGGGAGNTQPYAGNSYVVFGKAAGFGTGIDLSDIAAGTGTDGFVIYGEATGNLSGRSVASAGDFNGDGFDDIIIGATNAQPPGGLKPASGNSYVVFGKSGGFGATVALSDVSAGTGGFVIHGQDAFDSSGRSVASAGDVDGDGFADVIIGAPNADGSGNARSAAGDSYVVFGRDVMLTVDQFGSTASETLTGSAGIDNIVANLGDDILDGRGGADVLLGGAGNDRIKVSDLSFQRVDGGSGTDTLALDGAGITVDLSAIPNTRLRDIEVIDLTGTGDNTLVLSRLEVLNLSTTSNTLKVDGNAGDRAVFDVENWTKTGPSGGYNSYANGQATVLIDEDISVACFAAGTRISTESGDAAVEALRVGDRVRLADGGTRPIRWIGHRHFALARHPNPGRAWPIRIEADAIANGVPARALRLSPDHALALDGRLIPVRLLVNHGTIRRESTCASVTYYHIELDAHDVLLAEGTPVESYLDTGNRGMFENAGLPVVLHPDFSGQDGRRAGSCLPFDDTADAVKLVWDRLACRAAELGRRAAAPVVTRDAQVRIEARGRILSPVSVDSDRYSFVVPAGCETVRLLSRASRPSDIQPWHEDGRPLGLSVRRIRIADGPALLDLPLDHPDLTAGWWGLERHGGLPVRWTDGDAILPIGPGGMRQLDITAGRLAGYVVRPADGGEVLGGQALAV